MAMHRSMALLARHRCRLAGFLAAFSLLCPIAGMDQGWAQDIRELTPDHGISGKQPPIYWHDTEAKFDLDTSTAHWGVVIQQNGVPVERVALPEILAQVDAVRRASYDRLVVLADLAAGAHYVGVIGIHPARMLDEFWTSAPPGLSPDNRYVLLVRFYPMHGAEGYDDQYRLYDVLGPRALNWPGRPAQSAPPGDIVNYDTSLAGIPVYPLGAAMGRDNTNVPDSEAHHLVSSFVWDNDSRRAVFADETQGRMSLVIVIPEAGTNQHPRTLTFELTGDQNPCAQICLTSNVHALGWKGDSVDAELVMTPGDQPNREMRLNIPISQFVSAPEN